MNYFVPQHPYWCHVPEESNIEVVMYHIYDRTSNVWAGKENRWTLLRKDAMRFDTEVEALDHIKTYYGNMKNMTVLLAPGTSQLNTNEDNLERAVKDLVGGLLNSALSYFNHKAISTNVSVESIAWKSLAHHVQMALIGYKELTKIDS